MEKLYTTATHFCFHLQKKKKQQKENITKKKKKREQLGQPPRSIWRRERVRMRQQSGREADASGAQSIRHRRYNAASDVASSLNAANGRASFFSDVVVFSLYNTDYFFCESSYSSSTYAILFYIYDNAVFGHQLKELLLCPSSICHITTLVISSLTTAAASNSNIHTRPIYSIYFMCVCKTITQQTKEVGVALERKWRLSRPSSNCRSSI